MIHRFFVFLLAMLAGASLEALGAQGMPSRAYVEAISPAPAGGFRAPRMAPVAAVALPRPLEKGFVGQDESGRFRVATVRALEKAAAVDRWSAVQGGFVARLSASSAGAEGLRVRLDLGTVPGLMEVRVQGSDGAIESMFLDPTQANGAWTPWTDGELQVIEVFSAVRPSAGAVSIGGVLHFDLSPLAKAAGVCTLNTMCSSGDAALDAAIAERKKSEIKIQFIDNGSGFLCSATLINTERFPAPYVLTANHCINNADSAATVTTFWFYEAVSCTLFAPNPGTVQVTGGAQLVFANYNVDSTLMLMNQPPPSGAAYSGWNPARLVSGAPIVSISYPQGDTSRYAIGNISQEYRIDGQPQDMYGVRFSSGIIQGGSSGSGLFTLSNGSLQLRGILTGTTIRNGSGMSCTNLDEEALYSRFEIFEPQIDQYIRLAPQAADDAPNRAQDLFGAPVDPVADRALDLRSTPLAFDNRRIDYAGDLDVYRFFVSARSAVSVWAEGGLDTVGTILDSRGVALEASDDAQSSSLDFGITRMLEAGTYYALVGHWDAAGTGAYNLRMRADNVDVNYTDLWWNDAESGWGLNINHQGNILFATLFTYDTDGSQMWLVMSNGARQSDGSYLGTLYRASGPVFNAVPFTAVNLATVGTMKLTFTPDASGATLIYTVNGTSVTKTIKRQVFSTQPNCTWSAFDRSFASNYQDLWWNPAEPGWGVNIAHQGNILFATLFTYDAAGKGMWLVMSNGARSSQSTYTGTLYRTSGPAFNASPWVPITLTTVGSMAFTFSDGNNATMSYQVNGVQVTKTIQRQVFSIPKTECD